MDNDSAHHANIALRMYLTGDYVTLIDYDTDYLDKPHLHFWLCAISYNIFGVTTFAYKFPSFLFTILGTYSTYRLGRSLYNNETGKLAALIVASSFAYILANIDVRMDAILTASIIFATWQLVEFVHHKKIMNVVGAAWGLALGFCTKGHIAVFTPAVGIFFYILYRKDWRLFLNWKWLLMIIFFLLFISPVLYCYYLQFDLHPEKSVRGRDHISGIRFILLNQSIDRFRGDGHGFEAANDYFFFIHSFLWAFAPWSLLAYIAFVSRLKSFLSRKEEWLTTGVFAVIALLISFSGFKLPHYLNIIFPTTAVMTASFLLQYVNNIKWSKYIFITQIMMVVLLLLFSAVINVWVFPIHNFLIIVIGVILLALVFYYLINKNISKLQKAFYVSVATIIVTFFLLNANFYPRLLRYQAGNELAKDIKGKVDPATIYFWKDVYSFSFSFYTETLRKQFSDSVLQNNSSVWLLTDAAGLEVVKRNYKIHRQLSHIDFEITRLTLPFINPSKRKTKCSRLFLINISIK